MQTKLALLTLTSLLTVAPQAEADCPDKKSGTLQQIVESWVNNNQPGNLYGLCAVAMDKYGNKGFACSGKADPWHDLDSDTLFQIGSVTKTITATLLARRVAEGKLDLSDRVDPLLPSSYRRGDADPITIKQLATHHSGLPENPSAFLGPSYSLAQFDNCLDTGCLEPGNLYDYSNWGFQILGFTLAHQDGYGIDNWFPDADNAVLAPNSMNATKLYGGYSSSYFAAHAASSHTIDSNNQWVDRGTVPSERCAYGSADPSGCLYSSPHDMRLFLEYAMALRTPNQILGNARDVMRASYGDYSRPGIKTGLAWYFEDDIQCHVRQYTRVFKSGDLNGRHAWIGFLQDPSDPEGVARLGVVLMTNSDWKGDKDIGEMGHDFLSKVPF